MCISIFVEVEPAAVAAAALLYTYWHVNLTELLLSSTDRPITVSIRVAYIYIRRSSNGKSLVQKCARAQMRIHCYDLEREIWLLLHC